MTAARPEILAPAGGPASLQAAVRAGADAVYLGLEGFNARRSAENFTSQNLPDTVAFCHGRGVRLFVTLNTLVRQRELPEALRLARRCAECGVDGLIVQDLGLAACVRERAPSLPLHASTQMAVHNAAGARAAAALGMRRVVLARELSRAEIAEIHAAVPEMELEVFVHGALCMSVSGRCYLSALIGGRSGNRGLCAQACRLPFSAGGREHALSLKDLSLVRRLPELAALGVASCKIEGRMKRPEYVAAATLLCRKALRGEEITEEEQALLRAVFSRQGFTDGYFEGRRGGTMFGVRREEDAAGAKAAFGKVNTYLRGELPRIPVDFSLTARRGEPVALTATDGETGFAARAEGEAPEPARERATEPGRVREALAKTGGTPFFAREMQVALDDGLALRLSALNALRREALEALQARRAQPQSRPWRDAALPKPEKGRAAAPLALEYRFADWRGVPDALPAGARVLLPLEALAREAEKTRALAAQGITLAAELPPLCLGEADAARQARALEAVAGLGVTRAVCGNLGKIEAVRAAGLAPDGDYGLNLVNLAALRAYRAMGLERALLSFELTLPQLADCVEGECGAIVYGRLPAMLLRNCPFSGEAGCAGCRAGDGPKALTDRRGERFPLVCHHGYAELLNCRALFLADRLEAFAAAGLRFGRLYFTTESAQEAAHVIAQYETGATPPASYTRGLYYRGVQ